MSRTSAIAFTITGCIAGLSAMLAVAAVLSLWLLVPNDPALSQSANALMKLKPMGMIAAVAILLFLLAKWCFAKRA